MLIWTHIRTLFLLLFCSAWATTTLLAQLDGSELNGTQILRPTAEDSSELRLQRLEKLREKDTIIENKVVLELSQTRFRTLARHWWGMPTETDRKVMAKGRYSRYEKPLGADEMYEQEPAVYVQSTQINSKQNLVVWGWHPAWAGDKFHNYNFGLLTHAAFYAYKLNPFTGGYEDFEAIDQFKNGDFVKTAHKDSCKAMLTLSCHRGERSEIFFTSAKVVQRNLIDSLISVLNYAGGDGVEINFEELPIEYKDDFQDFVRELSFALREENPNFTIAMSLPLRDPEKVYDLGFLQNWVDVFIVSAYNFHLRPTGVSKVPLTPLLKPEAKWKRSYMSYSENISLDSVLRTSSAIKSIDLLHTDSYKKQLLDTLNMYILRAGITNLEYNTYDLGTVLGIIRATQDLRDNPYLRRALKATACRAELAKYYAARNPINMFLFEPEQDTIQIHEFDLFSGLEGIISESDSLEESLEETIDRYVQEIGAKHSTSLVLGLPYHGAVWALEGDKGVSFEGYMAYSEIRNLARANRLKVRYDKMHNSMIGVLVDTLGNPLKEIYFDNSTSLGLKMDLALEKKMGGVAVWALSYDHGYTELWRTLEEKFAAREIWNTKLERIERYKVAKSNKIHYTIAYQIKKANGVVFSTLLAMLFFMALGFGFSLLDWKVRDVMFYSGAFRIFYLVLFATIVLLIGNNLGLFNNWVATFLVGTILGGLLTWVASMLLKRQQKRLP